MKPPKRQVRTISVPSITDKKLNSAAEFRRKIDRDRTPVHPLLVIADLHRGCLKTLAKYLVQESGIPDAKVALELQRLITGSAAETNFQLVVIEHPESSFRRHSL